MILLSALLLVWGAPRAGAADAAASRIEEEAEAGDLLFSAREMRRGRVDFQKHLRTGASDLAYPEREGFVCGTRSYDELLNPPDKWTRLAGLDLAKAAALSLDDLLLQMAYAEVFLCSFESTSEIPPWYRVAQADLRRRGNAATPLLLELFHVHPFQQFREGLLFSIDSFPTISAAPYLEAARNYWLLHLMKTPPRTCYAIARLLSRHGTAQDMQLLMEMKKHPIGEVAFVIQPEIERMARRLSEAPKPGR